MDFDVSIHIDREPLDVFAFLRDKDLYTQKEGSPVLLLDKITPGTAGVGTRYREIVQMLPLFRGEFLSELTVFEPGQRLAESFEGGGMDGVLTYLFIPEEGGTRLVQQETVNPRGWLRIFGPVIKLTLGRAIVRRLEDIKWILEAGWVNLNEVSEGNLHQEIDCDPATGKEVW